MVKSDYSTIPAQLRPVFLLITLLLFSISSVSQNVPAYRVEKLPSNINSAYEEIKPVSSHNGDTLFFIRTGFPENKGGRHAGEDIWFTYRSFENSWQDPTNKLGKINNPVANIFAGLGLNSTIIYLFDYTEVGQRRCIGISAYDLKSGFVTEEVIDQEHAIEINDGFHDLYLHPNEKVLLISMRSNNTLGSEDIYISLKGENGSWSRPANLGAGINSRGFEISPFLSDDGMTLYFASNRPGGLGDADIYCAHRKGESWTDWSEPKNMGPPFNSPKFDAYLSKNKKGDFFIASNRTGKYSDIYKISLREIDAMAQNIQASATEPPDALRSGSGPSDAPPENLVVFFDFDKSNINPKERNKLYVFISENLRNGIRYQFSISGYTDDTGSENYNQKLSLKRARSISKIIRKSGVPKDIITVEGKGIYPSIENQKPDEMRRVEISVSVIE